MVRDDGRREALRVPVSEAERGAETYLRLADRLLPGRIVGFYLVGSTALGAFRPGRSDIDFIAVVEGDMEADELRRLRALHVISGCRSGVASARRGWSPTANTCNGVFIRRDDLAEAVSRIVPIASHTGRRFSVGGAFDVNPVIWKEFAERGVRIRGPVPASLGLVPENELLREWCLANLSSYWRSWAEASLVGRPHSGRRRPRWATAWATLGAPRLHRTIATGDIISKEAAGEYALEVFDPQWRPLILQGLAYRRRESIPGRHRGTASATRASGAFVLEVIRSARNIDVSE